jgi:drug/metabolite transporter (DMT)-like permease
MSGCLPSEAPPQVFRASVGTGCYNAAVISRARGVAELIAAAILFGLMAFFAKLAASGPGGLDGAEIALVRFAVGAAIFVGRAVLRGEPPRVVRRDLLFLRGFFGGVAVLLYFLAIVHLPVGTATLLNNTAPVFTMTFAALFLAEAVPAGSLVALLLASVGVTLVVYGQGRALGGGYFWLAVGLFSAVVSGAAVTAIRAARKTDGSWEVFGAFCLVGVLCTAPFALASFRPPSAAQWSLLIAVGLLSAGAQLLMTHALIGVEASTAGIIAQLTVVVAMLLGHVFQGEPFGPVSLVGALLTVVGASLVSTSPRRNRLPHINAVAEPHCGK